MNGKPDDRRVRKTKKALRQGLAILMEQKNIKDITVRELTDLVDMHRGTFYLHYRDIYDLQEQIENELVAEVTELFEQFNPMKHGKQPLAFLSQLLAYVADNAELCRALLGSNANRGFIDKLSVILHEKCMHAWMMEFSLGGTQQEMDYYGQYMIAGYIAIIGKWSAEGMRQSPEELAHLMSRIGMYGIGFVDRQAEEAGECT